MNNSSVICARRGFTLLEVLVAIAMLAIVMGAVFKVSAMAAESAERDRAGVMGLWVAQNRLAELRMFSEWPSVGEYQGESGQGGVKLYWKETVNSTSNEKFRRVEVEVYSTPQKDYRAARLVGYVYRKEEDEKSR